jgi:hypothetical protein
MAMASGTENVKKALRFTIAGCAVLAGLSIWKGDVSGYVMAALGCGTAIGSLIVLRVIHATEER